MTGRCGFKPMLLAGQKDEPHEDVVTEPERERHVPAIPEFLDVFGNERLIEVHWRLDTHQITDGHGKQRVAGKVEVKIAGIDVGHGNDPPA